MALLLVNNRFRRRLADSVSAVVQVSPFLLDVGDITLREAVALTRNTPTPRLDPQHPGATS
jgi:hypothetical protein